MQSCFWHAIRRRVDSHESAGLAMLEILTGFVSGCFRKSSNTAPTSRDAPRIDAAGLPEVQAHGLVVGGDRSVQYFIAMAQSARRSQAASASLRA